MGFLAKIVEAQADAALVQAVRSGEISFLCIRCERVSTDPNGARCSLCRTCRKWLSGVRLYPVALIWGMAVVTGPFIAGSLAALTWHRIGDLRKARIIGLQLLAASVGVLFFGPAVFLPPVPCAGLIWLGVTVALIGYATAGLGPLLTAHDAAGGRQGSVFVPILVALALAAPGGWLWVSGLKHLVSG